MLREGKWRSRVDILGQCVAQLALLLGQPLLHAVGTSVSFLCLSKANQCVAYRSRSLVMAVVDEMISVE